MLLIKNKIERQRLSAHFGQTGSAHPLLQVCSDVFMPRAGKLENRSVDAEDVFCLVAWLMDQLTNGSEMLEQHDVDQLWYSMQNSLREQTSVADRKVIVDSVFRIVRKLLCHHWDSYFCYDLLSKFTITIERESGKEPDEEQQQFQSGMYEYSEELDEWVNNIYDGHLCEEIELVLKGRTEKFKSIKPRGGRKSIMPDNITASFTYLPRVLHRSQRLQTFYGLLNNVYLQCDQKDFVDIFQGSSTTKKITWLRSIKELHYLINRLLELNYIELPKGYTKWQITCAHFNIMKSVKKNIDDSMTNDSYEIKPLTQKQFDNISKRLLSHDELDGYIRILSPELDTADEIRDSFNEPLKMRNYKDALNQGLSID